MKEKFTNPDNETGEWRFKQKSLDMIAAANRIIAEYQAGGYEITIRQLYYQFVQSKVVVGGEVFRNLDSNYKKLAKCMDDARKAGLVDWAAIVDRTRYLRKIANYPSPQGFMQRMVARYYAEDLWRDQVYYPEVWIEKDALIGVIERPCNELRVPFFAGRGYPSSSELYVAGKRFAAQRRAGKKPIMFYLGDHDPSGLDMTRSNNVALDMFARQGIEVVRLALNKDQIEEHDLAPDPAKQTDSRYWQYEMEHGEGSWELDALNPAQIDAIVREAIEGIIDRDKFDTNLEAETANGGHINGIADMWDEVLRYMKYHEHTLSGFDSDYLSSMSDVDDILIEFEAMDTPDEEDDAGPSTD